MNRRLFITGIGAAAAPVPVLSQAAQLQAIDAAWQEASACMAKQFCLAIDAARVQREALQRLCEEQAAQIVRNGREFSRVTKELKQLQS